VSLHSTEHLRFLKSLLKFRVKFLIIGGHASIYYGVRRTTSDLDILIEPTMANGESLLSALEFLNLEVPDILPNEFTSNLILSFGLEPDAVDILNYTPGIEFQKVYTNSISVDFSGIKVPMIDIRDLIRNKEALNRDDEKALMDRYDVEVLKKIIQKKSK
jgi:predicted nucleotidyltransferase